MQKVVEKGAANLQLFYYPTTSPDYNSSVSEEGLERLAAL